MVFHDTLIVPIHAPTSGWIENISCYSNPLNEYKKTIKIVIVSDHLDLWIRLNPIKDYQKCSSMKLIKIIHKSGIVGLGGAQFSSAKKLMLSVNKVHTLIVNAVESEPYITADNCLINNYINEILKGCEIISWICNIQTVLIAIQEDTIEVTSKLSEYIKNKSLFKICIMKNKYPGGSSKILIKSLTGQEIPYNKHAIDIGYLIFNVATIYSIKRAIINGEPLTERIITIVSDKYFLSKNFWTRIGTPIKYFLMNQKYKKYSDAIVYSGGPFMGKIIHDLNYSILKNINCIFIQFTKEKYKRTVQYNCIRCGYCADVCPVNLLPQQLYLYSKNGLHTKTKQHNILDCIECKACEKVCPSNIFLVEYFTKEKNIIKNIELETYLKKISFSRFKTREERLLNKGRIMNQNNIKNNNHVMTKIEEETQDIKKYIIRKKVQEAIKRMQNQK